MDGWIDYISSADDAEDAMTAPELTAGPGDVLTLPLEDAAGFAGRCPAAQGVDRVLGLRELPQDRGRRAPDPSSVVRQVRTRLGVSSRNLAQAGAPVAGWASGGKLRVIYVGEVRFDLDWRERRAGTPRRFLDLIVNGESL